jgi:hypothetical protein
MMPVAKMMGRKAEAHGFSIEMRAEYCVNLFSLVTFVSILLYSKRARISTTEVAEKLRRTLKKRGE